MRRLRQVGELHLLILALGGIILVAVLKTSVGADVPRSPYSVRSAGSNGALALRLWLESSGFEVRELAGRSRPPGDDVDALFILEPAASFTPEEAIVIHDWVLEGHTLIVGGITQAPTACCDPSRWRYPVWSMVSRGLWPAPL